MKEQPSKKEKIFCLTRKTVRYEYCYVSATDWEDAEQKGYEEELDWELRDAREEIDAEEEGE